MNFLIIVISGLIGFGIANTYTLKTKIFIQEMKWKMDIYDKIVTRKEVV